MITVNELPEGCLLCPYLKREDEGGSTIDTCSLLKDPDRAKNTVRAHSLWRDLKCPLPL